MPTYFARLTLTQPKTLTYFKFEPHPNEVNTFPIYVSQVSGIFLQRFISSLILKMLVVTTSQKIFQNFQLNFLKR